MEGEVCPVEGEVCHMEGEVCPMEGNVLWRTCPGGLWLILHNREGVCLWHAWRQNGKIFILC